MSYKFYKKLGFCLTEGRKEMKKKLLLVGTCIALFCTGCGTSLDELTNNVVSNIEDAKEETSATESPAPEETEAPEEAEVLSLGDKATVGNWKFTVKKAEVKAKIKDGEHYYYEPTDTGDRYVCVTLSVKNTGKEAETFLPRMYYPDDVTAVLYYEDYEYNPTELMSFDKDLCGESIKPLTNKNGIIAFSIPKKLAKKTGKLTLKIGTSEESVTYSLKK